jgi:hypothetical protein
VAFSKFSALAILSLTFTGCLSTIDSTSLQTPTPVPQDEAYNKLYRESSQDFEFVDKFVTKYRLHITQLNANFRQALATRHEQIFLEPQPMLTEASQKTAYFVSIYSQNSRLADIRDERLWSIQLRTGTSVLKPSAIQTIQPKERWSAFFPEITTWSSEYLVIFDQAPPQNQPDAVNAVSEFIMASPEGSITSKW